MQIFVKFVERFNCSVYSVPPCTYSFSTLTLSVSGSKGGGG